MKCRDTIMKELLPLYLEKALDGAGTVSVESHLASCADCRKELALLQKLSAEPVPDPGQAFWDAMPGQVYQKVQEQRSTRGFDLSGLIDRLILPRWALATAAAAAVLVVAWLVISPFNRADTPGMQEVYDAGYASLHDPVLTHPSTNMTDLSDSQLDTVNSWARQELASMAQETESVMPNTEGEVYDELADLNGPEIEKLSTMLTDYAEEG